MKKVDQRKKMVKSFDTGQFVRVEASRFLRLSYILYGIRDSRNPLTMSTRQTLRLRLGAYADDAAPAVSSTEIVSRPELLLSKDRGASNPLQVRERFSRTYDSF